MFGKLDLCIVAVALLLSAEVTRIAAQNCPTCEYYALFANEGAFNATEACPTPDAEACGPNTVCSTIDGLTYAFRCACVEGNFVEDRTTTSYACNDVDECMDGTSNCLRQADCQNTVGSFDCVCPSGYSGDGVSSCADEDECALNLHLCGDVELCENTNGSYTCRCNDTGYAWNGTACSDIDECADDSSCGSGETCSNTDGSFVCDCGDGFVRIAEFNCSDVDECVDTWNGTVNTSDNFRLPNTLCNVNASCVNTAGSYLCVCNDGYTGDGNVCEVLPECYYDHDCQKNAGCVFIEGKMKCLCKEGFELTEGQCEAVISSCTRDDECRANAKCVAYEDTFKCQCEEGYELRGDECVVATALTTTPPTPITKRTFLQLVAKYPHLHRYLITWKKFKMADAESVLRQFTKNMGHYLFQYTQRRNRAAAKRRSDYYN